MSASYDVRPGRAKVASAEPLAAEFSEWSSI